MKCIRRTGKAYIKFRQADSVGVGNHCQHMDRRVCVDCGRRIHRLDKRREGTAARSSDEPGRTLVDQAAEVVGICR